MYITKTKTISSLLSLSTNTPTCTTTYSTSHHHYRFTTTHRPTEHNPHPLPNFKTHKSKTPNFKILIQTPTSIISVQNWMWRLTLSAVETTPKETEMIRLGELVLE
ncbi:hypothetical protein Hanom_Chr10g00896191 [Helianthus anomalus]